MPSSSPANACTVPWGPYRVAQCTTQNIGTWEELDERNLPENENVMASRFTLAARHVGTAQEGAKIR